MTTVVPVMLCTGANLLVKDCIACRSMRCWSGSVAR
jgi:hypothetical protein